MAISDGKRLTSQLLDELRHERWFGRRAKERADLLVEICSELGSDWSVVGVESFVGRPIGRLTHGPTKSVLHLIPGGLFEMGFSAEEERVLRERFPLPAPDSEPVGDDSSGDAPFVESFFSDIGHVRPVHTVDVAPFLLGAAPLTRDEMAALLDDDELLEDDVDGAVHPRHIETVVAALTRHGLRLASEAEWEYAARAGGRTLFPDGNGGHAKPDVATTSFGLTLLGSYAEICADAWHGSYDGAPTDGRPWLGDGVRVARGGAENLFPWQDCGEWLSMLSAEREPVDDDSCFANFRVARSLFPDPIAYAKAARDARTTLPSP